MIQTLWHFVLEKIFKKIGLKDTIFYCFLIFVLYSQITGEQTFFKMFSDHSIQMEKEKEENHVKAMKKRENLNREVMLMFENYVLRHNLRTMLLIEFHNGGNNVIGLPFLKMTATMEYSSINKPEYYITNYIVNQPTSNFQNIYNTLENNEIILYEYGSGDKYLDYLMSIGYQSHMIKLYPIKVDNCLVGVIVVCSQGVLEPGFNTHMLPLIEKIQLYNSQNKR